MEGVRGGGGEVRRVHVLYFLSRHGTVEQPHLIRLHHLHRNGVHLRDVKRWLAELRGRDMPDSFSWSYKRRYKSGYVWQDLTDDELITPVSDNEYVLKGSELSSRAADLPLGEAFVPPEPKPQSPDTEISTESPPCIHNHLAEPGHDSPGALPPPPSSGSDVSDNSAKRASIIKKDGLWEQEAEVHNSNRSEPIPRPQAARKRLHVFRHLFRCGGAQANDAALTVVQRRERYQAVSGGSYKRTTMVDRYRDEKPGTQRSVTKSSN